MPDCWSIWWRLDLHQPKSNSFSVTDIFLLCTLSRYNPEKYSMRKSSEANEITSLGGQVFSDDLCALLIFTRTLVILRSRCLGCYAMLNCLSFLTPRSAVCDYCCLATLATTASVFAMSFPEAAILLVSTKDTNDFPFAG